MKNYTPILILLSIVLTLFACKDNRSSTDNGSDPSSDPTSKKIVESASGDFLSMIEADYCIEYKDRMVDCYKAHDAALKSDFMAKLPRNLNKPYDAPIAWEKYKTSKSFAGLWSDKCGFINQETDTKLSYYCPNLTGLAGIWLDSISTNNELIGSFNTEYKKTQDFSPSMQTSMILEAGNSLDFNNKDHRTFYWFYHMALAELMEADKKFKSINK